MKPLPALNISEALSFRILFKQPNTALIDFRAAFYGCVLGFGLLVFQIALEGDREGALQNVKAKLNVVRMLVVQNAQ